MHISDRLQMVASLVEACDCLADVGCDHGYLSIWLLREQVAKSAICMDLRPGPLAKAKENLAFFHMDSRAETRLSDGLAELSEQEADTLVIAGMGGELTKRILLAKPEVTAHFRQMILQPQSDIPEVRKTVHALGFRIVTEDRCIEDGKLYHAFRAVPGTGPVYSEADYISGIYGLTGNGRKIAITFLDERITKLQAILSGMEDSDKAETGKRREELKEELATTLEARRAFDNT